MAHILVRGMLIRQSEQASIFPGHAQTLHYYSFAGCTPLMLSITEGHLKTTIILLENGADITCSDIELNSPLSIAILNGQEDIIPLLLDNEVL